MASSTREIHRFGQFELNVEAAELRCNGHRLKLQPQPFKLLVLLARRHGDVVSRKDIQTELWPEGTFVDFDQSVNFAIKQIRDVLGDSAERPLYVETVPRRGYRFIAPVDRGVHQGEAEAAVPGGPTTVRLEKALWTNIAELRLAEARRRRVTYVAIAAGVIALAVLFAYVAIFVK